MMFLRASGTIGPIHAKSRSLFHCSREVPVQVVADFGDGEMRLRQPIVQHHSLGVVVSCSREGLGLRATSNDFETDCALNPSLVP
jgi:hypothetical protein